LHHAVRAFHETLRILDVLQVSTSDDQRDFAAFALGAAARMPCP
jgi:hypothetical protein